MVGRWISFWDGLFSGAMLVSERVLRKLFFQKLSPNLVRRDFRQNPPVKPQKQDIQSGTNLILIWLNFGFSSIYAYFLIFVCFCHIVSYDFHQPTHRTSNRLPCKVAPLKSPAARPGLPQHPWGKSQRSETPTCWKMVKDFFATFLWGYSEFCFKSRICLIDDFWGEIFDEIFILFHWPKWDPTPGRFKKHDRPWKKCHPKTKAKFQLVPTTILAGLSYLQGG